MLLKWAEALRWPSCSCTFPIAPISLAAPPPAAFRSSSCSQAQDHGGQLLPRPLRVGPRSSATCQSPFHTSFGDDFAAGYWKDNSVALLSPESSAAPAPTRTLCRSRSALSSPVACNISRLISLWGPGTRLWLDHNDFSDSSPWTS